jgi:DNA-binding PadR family transcriptional regulator
VKAECILSTGTLYGALKRLLDQGWIIRLDDANPKGNVRDRKVYKLSEHGRRVLKDEIARLNKLLTAAVNVWSRSIHERSAAVGRWIG